MPSVARWREAGGRVGETRLKVGRDHWVGVATWRCCKSQMNTRTRLPSSQQTQGHTLHHTAGGLPEYTGIKKCSLGVTSTITEVYEVNISHLECSQLKVRCGAQLRGETRLSR